MSKNKIVKIIFFVVWSAISVLGGIALSTELTKDEVLSGREISTSGGMNSLYIESSSRVKFTAVSTSRFLLQNENGETIEGEKEIPPLGWKEYVDINVGEPEYYLIKDVEIRPGKWSFAEGGAYFWLSSDQEITLTKGHSQLMQGLAWMTGGFAALCSLMVAIMVDIMITVARKTYASQENN